MTYADLAHAYLKLGYSPLPLPPRAKKSPPEGWTGADAPMASGADVQEWTESHPDGNVALRLPDGVIVLDVDNHKHPAQQTMVAAIQALGPLPVIGRSSGRAEDPVSGHRLFRVPAGTHFMANLKAAGFGEGVDIIQHAYRYIVAPGSTHPDGGVYRWYGVAGHEQFPAVADLPELPTPWVEALTKRAEPAREHSDDTSEYVELPESAQRRIDAYLESALGAIWAEMDDMKTWPEGKTDRFGGWEEGMLARTMRLASLVAAPWTPLTLDDAIQGLAQHAPKSGDFTLSTTVGKLTRALASPELQPAARPADLGDGDSWWEETMASIPGIEAPVAPPETWPIRQWSERGLIERALEAIDGRLVYVEGQGWIEWADGVWATPDALSSGDDVAAAWVARGIDKALEFELGKYDSENLRDAKGNEKEGTSPAAKFERWVDGLTANSHTAAARTMRRRAADYDLLISPERLDAGLYDLAVTNGIVDLRTGALREATKADFITRQVGVRYRPDAPRANFERFLESSLPDPELREYVQRVIGYSATGAHQEQVMFIHYGPKGANGKGTLFNALKNALGPHFGAASSKALLWSKNEKTGQDLIDLMGFRFLSLTETPEGSRLDDATVKSLTAGDWRADRAHFRGNTQYRITGKINVSTNHLPHVNPDGGMRRRMHIIPWLQSFADRPDANLELKLAGEREGILAWVVEGAMKWYADFVEHGTGLARPAAAVEALEEFLFGEDDVARWRASRTLPVADLGSSVGWTAADDLYQDYRRWVETEGERSTKTKRQFGIRLTELVGVKSKPVRIEGRVARAFPLSLDTAGTIDWTDSV